MNDPEIEFLGEAPSFLAARDWIRRISKHDSVVLIEGETGTGKELAARVLHYQGARRAGPFIPVNCGAIPDSLVESELFGHRQGAFTDARSNAPGVLMLANNGTLFLDEVDSLSTRAQVSMLRFLQDRTIRPLGSTREHKLDVRIISATNRKLENLVVQRLFRQDLYYRLNVLRVELPPLRERGADIAMFAKHFLKMLAKQQGVDPPELDATSMTWLQNHSWPGNIRELENLIEREFLLSDGGKVLHFTFLEVCRPRAKTDEPRWNYRRAKTQLVEEFDRRFLEGLMCHAQGNVALAARTAGKERRDFGRLLRKYSIQPANFRSTPPPL